MKWRLSKPRCTEWLLTRTAGPDLLLSLTGLAHQWTASSLVPGHWHPLPWSASGSHTWPASVDRARRGSPPPRLVLLLGGYLHTAPSHHRSIHSSFCGVSRYRALLPLLPNSRLSPPLSVVQMIRHPFCRAASCHIAHTLAGCQPVISTVKFKGVANVTVITQRNNLGGEEGVIHLQKGNTLYIQ